MAQVTRPVGGVPFIPSATSAAFLSQVAPAEGSTPPDIKLHSDEDT